MPCVQDLQEAETQGLWVPVLRSGPGRDSKPPAPALDPLSVSWVQTKKDLGLKKLQTRKSGQAWICPLRPSSSGDLKRIPAPQECEGWTRPHCGTRQVAAGLWRGGGGSVVMVKDSGEGCPGLEKPHTYRIHQIQEGGWEEARDTELGGASI